MYTWYHTTGNTQREVLLEDLRRNEGTSRLDATVLETLKSFGEGNGHVVNGCH